jgi:hypothetical protein
MRNRKSRAHARFSRDFQQNLSGRDLARSMDHRCEFACSWNPANRLKESSGEMAMRGIQAILTATQWQFYDSPSSAAIMAMRLG